jgi:hypothetical protein
MALEKPDGNIVGCEACHTARDWKDVRKFDHASTLFQLDGSHSSVSCQRCHKPVSADMGIEGVTFHALPRSCASCHDDEHGGQFDESGGKPTDCARCHRTQSWKPASYDHKAGSRYPLIGAHRQASCSRCHTTSKVLRGRARVVYRGTPHECSDCHIGRE